MKRFRIFVAMVAAAVLLSGCGVHSSLTSNVNLIQTNVVLQEANYHVVDNVTAEASATYIMGIGGMSRRALKETAVAELVEVANLKGPQALVNVSVKMSVQNVYVFWSKITYTATGTIIEFED